ncbi:MAG: GNAT family N-acetyltransferase [Phenylobacterium sp.]|jgi:RimJ/RimL family protein N-acetyltransferase|uniref:GNAT family N-acetyltransferase n=1 Tax=Phenylobacterium sp. TaxID=1871053 RepID=UPI0025F88127|nr:GNAT family protein [Phenylobacterium sp.]MCA3714936.1 GNAT family N-acetyltransferase [Phenylobacterium sp.]MCA3732192.1 GNAT family N-acetyltransferase [Phenylobacterium sp.]MCA3735296.1 GNAT family N-acetyltransferase [Phenylobacterium sp.]MCA3739675.1 GNAT family N-acetyltransferase [Phenylobacterium sp.]MCA6228017.1 GNAT family N-acetyltransferase [Phenylobacterium sp.]
MALELPHRALSNAFVTLEPLSEAHREPLRAACAADPDIWEAQYSLSLLGEHFDRFWTEKRPADAASGAWRHFAVMIGDRCVGLTAFLKIDRANAGLEIGLTYYAPEARGGPVNPSAKRLLLGEAFEAGFGRVQFHVDETNARSRAAVLKLGATFEGVQRWDRIVWTGRRRSTAIYSIIATEWPAVRAALDQRLAAFSP